MYPVIFGLFMCGLLFQSVGKESLTPPTGREGNDTLRRPVTDTVPDTTLSFTYENVRDYIFRRIYYPPEAKKKEIQGTVIVGFRITETGEIDRLRVVRRVHPLLDSAALHLIQDMPKWRPVYVRGEPTAFEYEVPVIFELVEPKP